MINNTQKISGIYKIINKKNGKYYIGSSDNILGSHGRWMEHINGLKSNRHENSYLQRSWNKYGMENFEFSILEEVPKPRLVEVEQTYLNCAIKDGKQCYNLSYSANGGGGFAGHKHSSESKLKTSLKLKGRPSPMKGRKIPPEKTVIVIITYTHSRTC
jgi:GIY-YIG catalytic domain.